MLPMQLDQLLDLWEKLGERERMCALVFCQRIYNGQRKFGKLSVDKKDWTYEAIEEALDASVYLTAMLSDRAEKAWNASLAEAEAEVLREEVPCQKEFTPDNQPSGAV